MTYLIKRRYIRKLKTLGYTYNQVGRYYYLDDGMIRHLITKRTRVYEIQEFKGVDSTVKFLGNEYPCKAYQFTYILEVKPNVPVEWYVEREK